MSINKVRTQNDSIIFGTFAQKFWLFFSLSLAVLGEAIIREPQPLKDLGWLAKFFIDWNEKLYWSLKNPVNILSGLLLIAAGVIMASLTFKNYLSSQNGQYSQIHFFESNSWDLQNPPKLSRAWLFISALLFVSVNIQLAQHHFSTFDFWLLVMAILIPTTLLLKNEYKTIFAIHPSVTYLDGILVFSLFALAIAAGSYYLNDFPAGWVQDEGPFWAMARKIALGIEKPPLFDFGVFTFPVASSYLQGWILNWAGINIWGWRFSSVLPAAATVFPLYFLAHQLFNRRVAITACILMIANPYWLLFSRLGYNNSQSLFPVTLCILLMAIGLRNKNFFYIWLAGLTAGLGFYTYFAAWLGIIVLFSILLWPPVLSGIRVKKTPIPAVILVIGFLMITLPRLIYGAASPTPLNLHFKIWETGAINTFYGRQVFGEERFEDIHSIKIKEEISIYYDPSLYGLLFLRGIVRTTSVMFDPLDYIEHTLSYGLAGPGSSIFFVLGIGFCLAGCNNPKFYIPMIWLTIGFFTLGVFASLPPRPTHLVAIIPVIALISAIGIEYFLQILKSPSIMEHKNIIQGLNIFSVCILLVISTLGFLHYFYFTPYFYFPVNQDDYISWLKRQMPPDSQLILVDIPAKTRNSDDEKILHLSENSYLVTSQSNLNANISQVQYWKNYVAFFDWKDGKEYPAMIADQIPNSTIQPAYTPGQQLQGYIVSDLEIDGTLKYPVLDGLKDLWNSPARDILLFCVTGIIVFVLTGNKARFQINHSKKEII